MATNHIDKEFALEFAEKSMPAILSLLLVEGKLDEDRLNDTHYVCSVIKENLVDIVSALRFIISIDDQFIEIAQYAANANLPIVVIVLVATAIEHKLNEFYRNSLHAKGLSEEEATEAIRSNVSTKLGWLLSLSTGCELEDDTKKRIMQIMDLRNAFVHYKYTPFGLDETHSFGYDALVGEVEKLGLQEILRFPGELQDELDAIIRHISPLTETVRKVTEAMFDERPRIS